MLVVVKVFLFNRRAKYVEVSMICFLNASSIFKVIYLYKFQICTEKSP